MKTRFVVTLAILLVAGAAGIAWAAQPAVESPADAPVVEAPAPEGDIVPAQLEELFVEPSETGACCFAECNEEKIRCIDQCPPYGDPDAETCRQNCWSAYDSCTRNC